MVVTVTKNVGGGKVEGEDDGEMKKKRMEKNHGHSTTETKGKNMKTKEQSPKISKKRKKVCELVKFSRFLNLPIEKLNLTKSHKFLKNKIISRNK